MERVKSRGKREDEFAATKAAAWAWYQRGSGSEGKPMSEFDARRTLRSPIPSRYKLEAVAATKEALKPKLLKSLLSPPSHNIIGDDKSHLLDKYEIERISKQLDHYTVTGDRYLAGEGTRNATAATVGSGGGGGSGRKKSTTDMTKVKNKTKGGFLWLRSHGMVITCGASSNDVVELTRGFRRPPEKPAKVVGDGNLRPRRTHAI